MLFWGKAFVPVWDNDKLFDPIGLDFMEQVGHRAMVGLQSLAIKISAPVLRQRFKGLKKRGFTSVLLKTAGFLLCQTGAKFNFKTIYR